MVAMAAGIAKKENRAGLVQLPETFVARIGFSRMDWKLSASLKLDTNRKKDLGKKVRLRKEIQVRNKPSRG